MVKPKEIVDKLGKHRLTLQYDPGKRDDERWSWTLKVMRTYEYKGSASSPAMCRVAAAKYLSPEERKVV